MFKLFTAPYLLQGGIRYSIAGYPQVGESVIQLVEELYKGSVFSWLVGQDVGDFVAEVLNQASLVDMLEDHVGDEGHICREETIKMSKRLALQSYFYRNKLVPF